MDIKLINIGFGNIVSAQRVVTIIGPESAPIKRIIQDGRDKGVVIDATYGRRTRSVLEKEETMNKPQGILLVLSGPSGAGKGTICGRLLEKRDHMAYSVSCTTREPRKGEVDGKNYFFKTREEFEEMIKNGGLLEHASVYGNYYGTPRQYVLDKLNEGLDVVLEIDPQGALQVKKSYPDGVFVFIVPPSLDELSKRIYKRGTDAVDVIKRRLSAATSELAYASKYDYIVVNDEVERATDKVSKIIDVEHLKVGRTYYIVDEICQQKTTEQD